MSQVRQERDSAELSYLCSLGSQALHLTGAVGGLKDMRLRGQG